MHKLTHTHTHTHLHTHTYTQTHLHTLTYTHTHTHTHTHIVYVCVYQCYSMRTRVVKTRKCANAEVFTTRVGSIIPKSLVNTMV